MGHRDNGPWKTTVRESHYGSYCSFTLLPRDDQSYGSEWLADLEMSYDWRQYNFAFGIENMFDAMLDETSPARRRETSGSSRTRATRRSA